MSDKIINFYEKLPKHLKSETKLDKHFNKHYILPILCCVLLAVVVQVKLTAS